MNIITKTNRDVFLRERNRFYQCGWLDAERGDRQQVRGKSDMDPDQDVNENEYVIGYNDSMNNQFTIDGNV
jgi:hypothetical protein